MTLIQSAVSCFARTRLRSLQFMPLSFIYLIVL